MELHFPSLAGLASTTSAYISHASPVVYVILGIFVAFFILDIFIGAHEDAVQTHDEWV